MNATSILELVAKGVTLVESLAPAYTAIIELIQKYNSGEEITEEELAAVSAILDAQLNTFNSPLEDA